MVVSTKWVCRDAAHATVALREPAFVLTAYQRGVRVKLDHDLAFAVADSFPVGVRGAMGPWRDGGSAARWPMAYGQQARSGVSHQGSAWGSYGEQSR
jgi:hypothetical protein